MVGSNGFFVGQLGLGDIGLIEISMVSMTVLLSFLLANDHQEMRYTNVI